MEHEWQDLSKGLLKAPFEFSLWQKLIHDAETQNKRTLDEILGYSQIDMLRHTYRAFLTKFPLFSKYWSTLAKWELKFGSRDRASKVFLEGMKFVSFDIDYWISYLSFKVESVTNDTKEVLKLFEEARYKIGYSYYSSGFYALYFSFLKCYATKENRYMDKYAILLRQVIELPIYNNLIFYKELLEYISEPNVTNSKLQLLIPDCQLKELKKQEKNSLPAISKKIEGYLSDIFSISQYDSHQIYQFETQVGKHFQFNLVELSREEIQVWKLYLDYVQQNYPFSLLQQLYERLLLSSATSSEIAIRYSDLLVLLNRKSQARSVLERSSTFSSTRQKFESLIRLVDLEISQNNLNRAKDLIVNYLEVNQEVPLEIYEKLVQLESLASPHDDGTYLCKLTSEIVVKTHSSQFLIGLKNYRIEPIVLFNFLSLFVSKEGKFYNIGKQLNLEKCLSFWILYDNLSTS